MSGDQSGKPRTSALVGCMTVYATGCLLHTMNEDELLSGGPPSMTAMQMLVTFSVIALPTAWLVAKYLFATEDKLCNEII